MKTVSQVLAALKKKGSEQTRKIYLRHGAPEDMFGVKIADMKVIAKKIKGQQQLAYDLYDSGNYDAMYLAGLVVDGSQMNKRQLQSWATKAKWQGLAEYTVAWVAVESNHARDMALKWIDSKKETVASSGWATYAGLVAVHPDDQLNLGEIKVLIDRVVNQIDDAPNRVRYTMNGFVISVGAYVRPLLKKAKAAAKKIGEVSVDMGDTSCKVPQAMATIEKIEKAGRVGKKRKTIKC